MRAARWALALCLVLAGCTSGSPERTAAPAPPVERSVVFRSHDLGDGVRVHSRTLPGRTSAPWLVYVHGGSWRAGRGNSPRGDEWARHEVPRGFQVFALDYRLSTRARWPAQREDVATAVEWIRARATTFGIDLARGAIVGESAGGHLAAIEASRGRFAAAVDLAGVVDPQAALDAPLADLGDAALGLVGCPVAACPRRWRDTRAITYVGPHTPPMLVVHAVDDPIVPSSMSRAFAADLRRAGRPVTLRIVPGGAHALMLLPSVLARIDAFLEQV